MDAELKASLPSTFQALNEFRKAGKYTDVNIHVDEELFACHRNVLAASCEYFDKLFSSDFQESKENDIVLKEVDSNVFKDILEFVYTGTVTFTDENIFQLLKVGNYLGVKHVEDICIKHINENYHLERLPEMCVFMMSHCKAESLKEIVKRMANNFQAIVTMDYFLDIPSHVMKVLLDFKVQENSAFFKSGDAIFAILKWFRKDPEGRQKTLWSLREQLPEGPTTDSLLQFIMCELLNTSQKQLLANNEENLLEYHGSTKLETLHLYVRATNLTTCRASILEIELDAYKRNWKESASKVICPSKDTLKSVLINNRQFFFTYDDYDNRFWSDYLNPKSFLRCPPVTFRTYSMVNINDYVYFYGKPPSSDTSNQTLFYRFNARTNSWFPLDEFSESDPNGMLIPFDNSSLCLFSNNNIQIFDHRTYNWYKINEYEIVDFSACTYNGTIYISGGCSASRNYRKWLTLLQTVYPNTKYNFKAEMQFPKQRHILIPFMDHLWAVDQNNLKGEIYDPKNDTWEGMISLPKKVRIDDSVYVLDKLEDGIVRPVYVD